jgi:hypothetical protein
MGFFMVRLKWHYLHFTNLMLLLGKLLMLMYFCVYIFKNKTKEVYNLMFSVLKQKTRNRSFQTLVVDFEDSVVLAFKEIFPTISINFCLLYFAQILYRNL